MHDLALVLVANLSAPNVNGLAGHWISDVASASTLREAIQTMPVCRKSWRSEVRQERLDFARECMTGWLTQSNDAFADGYRSTF